MEYIKDLESLGNLISKFFRKGTSTNNYLLLDAYKNHIGQKKLGFVANGQNIAFLIEKSDFLQIFFYLNDLSEGLVFPPGKPLVMEIIYRGEQHKPTEIFRYWETYGFKLHLTRDNMFATFNKLNVQVNNTENIILKYADNEKEVIFTEKLLKSTLDKYTGDQLAIEEVRQFVTDKNVLCAYYNDEMAGVLQFEIKNKVVWLGHIAVDERFRGKGVANGLVEKYIIDNNFDENTKYQLWVIQDNLGAVNLYRKFGFIYGNKSTTSMLKIHN
jgi:ribosomal protein S18 acetylase RimI-like enzyme